MKVLVVLVLGVLLARAAPTTGEMRAWAGELSSELASLADGVLCHADFQSTLEAQRGANRSLAVDGETLVREVAARLVSRFTRATESAVAIRERAQRLNAGQDTAPFDSTPECCTVVVDDQPIAWKFAQRVDFSQSCKRYPEGVSATSPGVSSFETWSLGLDQTFSQEETESPIAWGYFGHTTGTYKIFPSAVSSSCTSYDPRFRPWWLAAQTEPKAVVIIIDKSGSMSSNGRMPRARGAALAVLDTLNPNDWFTVIAFDSTTQGPPGCFATQLALANPYNIGSVKQWVSTIQAGGGTDYGSAFGRARSIVSSSDARARALKTAILFLTDGAPQDSESVYLPQITGGPAEWRWFAFGLGISDNSDAAVKLNGVAAAGRTSSATLIPDGGNLRSAMSSYYNEPYFLQANVGQCVTTVPYFDATGLGLVLTIACPAHTSSVDLIGVVGVDVSLSILLQDLAEVRAAGGWSIVIDSSRRTYVHPRLTSPGFVDQDPNFVDVTDLESSPAFESNVLQSMLASGNGSLTTTIEQVVSRGNAGQDGSETRTIEVTYFWQPLSGTDLFLAIVIPTDRQQQSLFPGVPTDPGHIYHRIDLDPQGEDISTDRRRGGFLTNAGDSDPTPGAKLAPFAHAEETLYQNRPEVLSNVTDFLEWARQPYSPGNIAANRRYSNPEKLHADLQILAQVKSCWNQVNSNIPLYRYIGTESGIFYTTPASVYVPEYDNTVRPWYKRARLTESAPLIALSTPYRDAATNKIVITLSKALLDYSGRLFGVAGMDFELNSIRSIFDRIVQCPSDSKCFLMDDAGFLINSPNGGGDDVNLVPQKFISKHSRQLGQFADGLLSAGQTSGGMIKQFCLDYSDLTRQAFYDIADVELSGSSTCGGVSYIVTPVPQSTFRLVTVYNLGNTANCCSETCSLLASPTQCEAPCSTEIALQDRCRSFTPSTSELAYPSCPADPPALRSQEPNGSGLSTGAIVGIAVGAAVAVALIVIIIVVVVVKRGSARGAANHAAVQMSQPAANDVHIAASAPPLNAL